MSATGERDSNAPSSRVPADDVAALLRPPLLGLLRGDTQALPQLYRIVLDVCLALEAKNGKQPSPIGHVRAGWHAAQMTHEVCVLAGSGTQELLGAAWKAARTELPGRIKPPPGSRVLRIGRLFLPRQAYQRLAERVADLREDVFESLARGEIWRARVLHIVHIVIIATGPLRSIFAWICRCWRPD